MIPRRHYTILVLTLVLIGGWIGVSNAHRSGCHRWHSCPSDRGTYVCGDLGYCSQCPDNDYCQGGQPRSTAQRTPQPTQPSTPQPLTASVVRVIDGDTIEVDLHGTREKVRYIGMNTPETHHPIKGVEVFGPEAAEANRKLVEGKAVRLELDIQQRDKYGRLLAYVYVGDLMVNAELVRQVYAQVMTIPPNVKNQELFLKLQREAREAKRGLWGP